MRRLAALLALCLVLWVGVSAQAAENLLGNGGFESLNASGKPVDWYETAYRSQPGYSRLSITGDAAHSGAYSAMVENLSENDARFTCTVRVKPSTLYRLSAYVLVESMEDTGNGANLAIENIYSFSDGVFDTHGEWQKIEWYGETGEKQKELTLGVRVGGYSAESVGKAYFDDVVLEEVDRLPTGIVASLWYDAGASHSASSTDGASARKHTAAYVVAALCFLCLAYLGRSLLQRQSEGRFAPLALGVCLALAAAVRIWLGLTVPGYEVDINCFTAWSLRMATRGPAGFYAPDFFCDYPPGAMLLLWPVGLLLRSLGGDLQLLIVKLPAILCDLAGGVCLYAFARRKRLSSTASVFLSALYLLNPASLVNGAAWGQMDSLLALMILLTAIAAMDENWRLALPLFVVSALVKPQALLFAPIGVVWLTRSLLSRRDQLREVGIGLGAALLCALVIVLPFSIHQEFGWLFRLYAQTLSSYAYATLNTANLFYLIGANWMGLEQAVPGWLMLLSAVLCGALGALLVRRRRSLAFVFLVLGPVFLVCCLAKATYAAFGYVIMAGIYAFALIPLLRPGERGRLPFAMALSLIGIYVLGIKVHERYLFPALLLLPAAYAESRDRRVMGLFAGFSATTFVNTAIVLENSILLGAAQGHLNPDTLWLNRILCALNLLLCAWAAYVWLTGLRASTVEPEREKDVSPSALRALREPGDHRLHWAWKDSLLVCAVTAVYAVVTFWHLGSTVAPQTAWVSVDSEESVVLSLPESQTFHVLYYAGVSYNDFSIQVSEDGENWSPKTLCEMREGMCYTWRYAVNVSKDPNGKAVYASQSPQNLRSFTGKYLRINAETAGLNLWEVVVRDLDGQTVPLRLESWTGDTRASEHPPEHLIDEGNTCVGEPGWYNGTYFDEIYHARTAYEHLHGQVPYETTHPPLGKLLMAASIAVFGMTPFGWRFAGAFIGVLMLPALYVLALQLTHRRSVAAVSMTALALDLMHFTQTRIATIDSFPVFFILLSYAFMVRYLQMDGLGQPRKVQLWDRSFARTLLPLLGSGVCMGLSIASKWIGLYSAVGLAALFFLAVTRQLRVADAAERTRATSMRGRVARSFTLSRVMITCLFCVLFFLVIPAAIYCLCYIPYLSPNGPVTLHRIWLAQKGMLSYHSTPGLGMDHPFQSPWWQWPFILKPMWFAQDHFEPAGYASTIMCMGNPWVFYIGAFAMAGALLACLIRWMRPDDGRLCPAGEQDGGWPLTVLFFGFLAQYLPWVLVPRSMYIYHYFASVPFIILATAWWMDLLKPRLKRMVIALYLLGALVFFVLFFPYASGRLTSTAWLDAMKWFSKLYY